MSDIVSLETAVKLKAHGFPQPQPQRGQAWYMETWRQYHDGRDQELVWDAHWLRNNMHESTGQVYFAATSTDILNELPTGTIITKESGAVPIYYEVRYKGRIYAEGMSLVGALSDAYLKM